MKKLLFTLIICLASMITFAQEEENDTLVPQTPQEPRFERLYFKAKEMPTKCVLAKNKSESYMREVNIKFYDKFRHVKQSIQIANIRPGKKGKVDYVNLKRMLKTWGKQLDSRNFDLVVEIELPTGFEILSTEYKHNKMKINFIDGGRWK